MRLALLVNPAARAGAHSSIAIRAADRLREHGIRTSIISGGSAAESSDLLRAAIGLDIDAVAVVGGDGTVNLAIRELHTTSIPLGIIPAGTGNDFATTLGLRELDVVAAADAIADGFTRTVDLAEVTRADGSKTMFATVLASGFDSKVNDRANAMRWPRGGSRYNIAVVVEFLRLAGIHYQIDWDDADGVRQHFDGELLMATLANGRTYGGGIPIAPSADHSDGFLDLVMVQPAGRIALVRLLAKVYRAAHEKSQGVSIVQARWARISAVETMAYADGDPLGLLPLEVRAVPNALTVFAPRPTGQ
ncbi:diacylglycerol kinase family protein (plasmid) [Coraliomargarita sp. W4R53]